MSIKKATINSISRNKTHRHTVMETIKEELYPETLFPIHNYPDVHALLFSLFLEIVKSRPELGKLYRGDKEHKRIRELTVELLAFKNVLLNHPRIVVLIYRRYIEKFIIYKHKKPAEREDILQEVLTRLIEKKIYQIQKKYDFNFKKIPSFTSYLMVSVRNIYIDIIRERMVRPLTAGDVDEINDIPDLRGDYKMINKLMVKEELIKLQTILILFYKTRAKLELCLKLKYRIPLRVEDVIRCFPDINEDDIQILMDDYKSARDKRLFEKILIVFNRYGSRENKSDTLRKWINVKTDEIIAHLNRTHKLKVYNSNNFADFVALYYRDIEGLGESVG
ncbi:MAG: hypothetical protein GY757_15660 [bacterium]|nr:hypothetical protein [bacterium]